MRIGYARVSTDDQTLDLQRDAMKRAKCRQFYEEHASGKNTVRPQLEACLKSLREGDTSRRSPTALYRVAETIDFIRMRHAGETLPAIASQLNALNIRTALKGTDYLSLGPRIRGRLKGI
jgi:hypothetical protein